MISVANLLAADLDVLAADIADGLAARLGETVEVKRGAGLDDFVAGRADIALICGLAYALVHDAHPGRFAALAAPRVDEPRSGAAPVYFSELVVAAPGRARCLEDLAGARLAYNETLSFSGYRALEAALRARGLGWDLFAERLRSGSHHESMQRLRRGEADVAAIDSHVLLLAGRRDPRLAAALRVVESLGPYPAPPLAVNTGTCRVPAALLREVLAALPAARLAPLAIRRWQAVENRDYDPIRAATRGLPGLHL